jgi:hypothetical protein
MMVKMKCDQCECYVMEDRMWAKKCNGYLYCWGCGERTHHTQITLRRSYGANHM